MAVLVLLRHGESAWNAADVFTGWIDVRLSDHGKQQAHEAGQLLTTRHFPRRRAHLGDQAPGGGQ